MLSKGLVLTTTKALTLLLAIACIVSVYILFNKVFYEFHILPLELQYRKNALLLARVLMSEENLIYVDEASFHITFDAEKLNEINNKPIKEIGYPNSFSLISIVDVENGNMWNFYIEPKGVEEKDLKKFLSCRWEYTKLFVLPQTGPLEGGIAFVRGNLNKFTTCLLEKMKTKGSYYDEFPVSIRYGDETRVGKLLLTYVQG